MMNSLELCRFAIKIRQIKSRATKNRVEQCLKYMRLVSNILLNQY